MAPTNRTNENRLLWILVWASITCLVLTMSFGAQQALYYRSKQDKIVETLETVVNNKYTKLEIQELWEQFLRDNPTLKAPREWQWLPPPGNMAPQPDADMLFEERINNLEERIVQVETFFQDR